MLTAFRKYSFFLVLSACCLALGEARADEKLPSLDEITAELQQKKAEAEPFDPAKVKVDIESLGLDALDERDKAGEIKKEEKQEEKSKEEVKIVQPKAPEKPTPKTSSETKIIDDSVEKKIEEKKQVEVIKPVATTSADIKKPTEKYINSVKKQNLKKRLEQEKKRERSAKENLKKLQELRAQYLIKIDKNKEQEEFFATEEKIIPQRKTFSQFISDEAPAIPILNRYRTQDNLHIPVILTHKEKIDIMFDAIRQRYDTEYFNAAYKNVENPNEINENGDTILTYAILIQNYGVIASVLAKGADPNMPNSLGYTPVNIAIELADNRALNLLAENKADLTNYLDAFGRNYLMYAVRVGFLPAVELFFKKGIDINAMDDDGFTALAIAHRYKRDIIVKYLLQNGAKTWIEKPYEPEKKSLIKELENRWKN